MIHLEGHEFVRLLRREDGDRAVFETRYQGRRSCTRLLLYPVERSRNAVVSAIAMNGRGSAAGMPAAVRDTLEAYRVRHHLGAVDYLPAVLDAGVAVDAPSADVPVPPEGSGWAYVTTAWMEGVHLDEALRSLPDGAARRQLMGHVADTLARLHEHLVSFGDLKPTNVIVNDLDRVTGRALVALIDLDTLREVPGADACVQTTAATQEYAAPEQISRFETWLTSDVWAFGETLVRVVGGGHGVEALEPSWRAVVLACRQLEPLQRPSARQLAAHLLSGELLPTYAVSADATRRVPEDAQATRYVEDIAANSGASPVSHPADIALHRSTEVEHERVPRRPAAEDDGRGRSSSRGGVIFMVAGVALVGTLCALIAGFMIVSEYRTACSTLDGLRAELRQHKVDGAKNGSKTLNDIVGRGDAALEICASSPSGRGMLALAKVWQQRWHMANVKAITPAAFEALRPTIDAVRNIDTPEALAAVVSFESAGCRLLPDGTSERLTLCKHAHDLATTAQTRAPGSEWGWLRVEIAWADAMAGLGIVQQVAGAGDQLDQAASKASEMLPRCVIPASDLAQAPVNAPEMIETCMQIAGYARDFQAYDAQVMQLVDIYRTLGRPVASTLEKIYKYVSPKCSAFTVGDDHLPTRRRARYGDGGWDDFCRVAGARAAGCGDRAPRPTRELCYCCPITGADCQWTTVPYFGCSSTMYWRCSEQVQMVEAAGVPWPALEEATSSLSACVF